MNEIEANGRRPRIALTGGIACGKSRLAEALNRLGVETLDADDVVHTILPEAERRRLVEEGVFRDKARRRALEAQLWPKVRAVFDEWESGGCEGGLRVAVIPLLFEARWEAKYDIICCVVCEERTQIERMTSKRGYTCDEALGRLAAQMPVSEKAAKSHYVIHNNGSCEELEKEAAKFVAWLKKKEEEYERRV